MPVLQCLTWGVLETDFKSNSFFFRVIVIHFRSLKVIIKKDNLYLNAGAIFLINQVMIFLVIFVLLLFSFIYYRSMFASYLQGWRVDSCIHPVSTELLSRGFLSGAPVSSPSPSTCVIVWLSSVSMWLCFVWVSERSVSSVCKRAVRVKLLSVCPAGRWLITTLTCILSSSQSPTSCRLWRPSWREWFFYK